MVLPNQPNGNEERREAKENDAALSMQVLTRQKGVKLEIHVTAKNV